MLELDQLAARFDPAAGTVEGAAMTRRHLSDLRGCFADAKAYEAALCSGDPLVYSVASIEPDSGLGALHYALGLLMPGHVGTEYFMTKGHLHAWREAAEVYIGLSGEGVLLLEDETSGESRLAPLRPNQAVYVPGHTAHRTINTGSAPLSYLGIYPAKAGHDYGTLARSNFRRVVLARAGRPVMVDRASLQS